MSDDSDIDAYLIAYYLLARFSLTVDDTVMQRAKQEAAGLVNQKSNLARDNADVVLATRWQSELEVGLSKDLARELLQYGYSRGG